MGRERKRTRMKAKVAGSGAAAQGKKATAAGEQGVAVGGEAEVHGDVIAPGAIKTVNVYKRGTNGGSGGPKASRSKALTTYLDKFRRACLLLPLAPLGGDESCEKEPTLEDVYIDLDTTAFRELTDAEKRAEPEWQRLARRPGGGDQRPVRAVEAFQDHTRLALLGDAGSGKSAFLRNVMARQCGMLLGEKRRKDATATTDLGSLLPVLVTLRDLVPRLVSLDVDRLGDAKRAQALCRALEDQLADDLESLGAKAFTDTLLERLEAGSVLLGFDGLDEVPESARERVRATVSAALRAWQVKRVVVTCRTRSYEGKGELKGFTAFTLAPFDEEKIRHFVTGWYEAQRVIGRFDERKAKDRAEELATAATGADLRELASNPMLLTTMALLHQRDVGLPKERVKVYDLAVQVLIQRWQRHRAGSAGIHESIQPFFHETNKLREAMERLAYETHRLGSDAGRNRAQGDGSGSGDLARGTAIDLLDRHHLSSAAAAEHFLDYVDTCAGLLIGRGGAPGKPSAYGFPHRTFQEYLAGAFLVSQRHPERQIRRHAEEGDFWSLAVALGGEELFFNLRRTHELLDLAYHLCPTRAPAAAAEWRALVWSGRMAVVAERKTIEADHEEPDGGGAYLDRLIGRLVEALACPLPAVERAEAGRVLAQLGDPREAVTSVDAMAFCVVPAGPLRMGSNDPDELVIAPEKPVHEVDVGSFQIARWPVTCAQYGAFIAAGGYAEERFWPEAKAAGVWKSGTIMSRFEQEPTAGPRVLPAIYGLANQPMVGVSWYEALAFTRWLTERWRASSKIRPEQSVALPSEAEWEKAARGGKTVADGSANAAPERRYPWGDEWDPERANTFESRIGRPSAVGCFSRGASVYGVGDLIGNVWEWTRSLTMDYPYRAEDGRERLDAGADSGRVVRGGAFFNDPRLARSAARYDVNPDFRFGDIGFRVIVSPP